MAGALIKELFNKGIVTAKDPTLLVEGELQLANECVYRKFDPAIYGAWNRSEYDSTPVVVDAVKGLVNLNFDNVLQTDKLLGYLGTKIYHGDITAITGSLDTPLTGPGTVSGCTISGTSLTTSVSNGFQYIPVGSRVIHANIPAGCVVLAVPTTQSITLSISSTAGSSLTVAFVAGIPIVFTDNDDENLDAVQYGNSYFLLAGRGNPIQKIDYVTYGTTLFFQGRRAGLEPVTTFADGSGTNSTSLTQPSQFSGPSVIAGTWNANLGAGFYWFLVTEAINATKTSSDVESAYTANSGRARVIQITNVTTDAVKITFPTVTNAAANSLNQATHWCIYMSQKQGDNINMPSLATFTLVAVEDISATFSLLTDSVVQQESLTLSTNSVLAGAVTNVTGAYTFYDNSEASVVNAATATIQYGGAGLGTGGIYTGLTVRGVTINPRMRLNANGSIPFSFALVAGSKRTPTQYGNVSSDHFAEYPFGGQTDRMGVNWVEGDFANGTFFIEISIRGGGFFGFGTLLDGIRIQVFYTGTSVNYDGRPFSVVTYRSQVGTTVSDPSNLPPPAADTGDVFQGHLVLNDKSQSNKIVYSLPNNPEAFPKPYFMALNSRRRDRVNFIRTVGQVLVVGMQASIKRINYLPTEADPDFQLGRAHEDLALDHGIVGPMAGDIVDITGQGPVLVYVAYNGIHMTDGITTRFINTDLDWTNTVDMTNLSKCILRIYPRENLIAFFYAPFGGNGSNSKCLLFSYAPDKIKDGGFLPCTGPNSVAGRASCTVFLNGVSYLFSGHDSNGKVYVEDNGSTLPSGYTAGSSSVKNTPVIRTRRIYPGDLWREAREERIYVLTSAAGATVSKTASTTVDLTTLTSSAAFDSTVVEGMIVTGDNIPPGTVVVTKSDPSNIIMSQAALATGSGTVVFSSGTLAVQVRGQNIKEAAIDLGDPVYDSTVIGGLLEVLPDNMRQSFELEISRMTKPDGTLVDLSVTTRLHYFAYLLFDSGLLSKRNA